MRIHCISWLLAVLMVAGGLVVLDASSAAESSRPVPLLATEVHPLLIGSEIPEVALQTEAGDSVDLKAEALKQPTVIIFYRGGW